MGCFTSKHTRKWPVADEIKNINSVPNKGIKTKMYVYKVYDGDTCSVVFRHGGEFLKTNIRLNGIDAPELKTDNELEKLAGELVAGYVREMINEKEITAVLIKHDKYGSRYVGDIYLNDNTTLSEHLLLRGYVINYGGGKKEEWTNEKLQSIINQF
jgi:endonuclease YncB( thermonuclease family)